MKRETGCFLVRRRSGGVRPGGRPARRAAAGAGLRDGQPSASTTCSRSQGIRHVMNSRSLGFADEVLDETGGAGVDIVLDSLNKEYYRPGCGCSRPAAVCRAWQDRGLVRPGEVPVRLPSGLSQLRPERVRRGQRLRINGEILRIVGGRPATAGRGHCQPPSTAWTRPRRRSAVLSRGANVGKLVLSLAAEGGTRGPPRADRPGPQVPDHGRAGRARRADRAQARRVRRPPPRAGQPRAVAADEAARLEASLPDGTRVSVHQADLSRREDVSRADGRARSGRQAARRRRPRGRRARRRSPGLADLGTHRHGVRREGVRQLAAARGACRAARAAVLRRLLVDLRGDRPARRTTRQATPSSTP